MARSEQGLKEALEKIPQIREQFWTDASIPGEDNNLNVALERAGRVADFIELADMMCRDALERNESCGGHFRVEHQEEDGEAKRDQENHSHAAVWEFKGDDSAPQMHKEQLEFEAVDPSVKRSYK